MFRAHFGTRRTAVIVVATGLLGLASVAPALADGKSYPPIADPVVAKECGACHMRYPAGLMPAASWQRIMAGLKDHFGENADLDAATALHVATYLGANADREAPKRGRPGVTPAVAEAPLRITELAWFKRKHGPRRISPEALRRKNAKSAGDCVACHQDAEKGMFDE